MKISSKSILVLIIFKMVVLLPSFFIDGAETEPRPLASDMKKEYYLSKLRSPSPDFSAKLRYIDSLDRSGLLSPGELMREKTEIYLSSGHYQRAVESLSRLLDKEGLSPDTLLFALYNRAYARQALGNYEGTLDDLYRIEITEKPDSLLSYTLYSNFLLARICRISGQFAKSDTVLKKTGELIPEMEKDSAARYVLQYKWQLEMASAYIDSKDYVKALSALRKAARFSMDKESESLVQMGMAELYHHIGESDIAEDYYKSFISSSPSSINRLYAISNYCSFLVDEKRYTEAVDLCRSQIDYARSNGIIHVMASLYQTLAKALYAQKEYKGAFDAYARFYELNDSIFYAVSPRLTREYEEKLILHRLKSNAPESHSEGWPWLVGWILIGVIAVLSCALALTLFRLIRRRGFETVPIVSESVIPEESGEEGNIVTSDELNRQCVGLALQLSEMNQLIDNICDVALDGARSEQERKTEINKLRTAHGSTQNFWELFRISFEKVHPTFMANLRKVHPDLTKGEVRMCSFLVMELTTKEIAMLTSRSVRTVESMKYRLSKKFGITSGQTTKDYLLSFMRDDTPST